MKQQERVNNKTVFLKKMSLSSMMSAAVGLIVFSVSVIALVAFVRLYRNSMEQNAITSSEQAIVQVRNTITSYIEDMSEMMDMIRQNISQDEREKNEFFEKLMEIRSDVVMVTSYSENGDLRQCWSNGYELKERIVQNLSYIKISEEDHKLNISSPHVASLFVDAYPWVVSIAQHVRDSNGEIIQISMDIRFSSIANYVDEVGIGQHGYSFIMDTQGNLVYHPQQQLIYTGLKTEDTEGLQLLADGSHMKDNAIYTISTLEKCPWRIVGVCYVDEMVTSKVESMVRMVILLLVSVLLAAFLSGIYFSRLISKPANSLGEAMREFEKDAENFCFEPVNGTSEIEALSDSFGHMVVRIQRLMEKVRQEEISLRKTELNALQAQINPHFLYNTLDSIAWMCEEGRNAEAVEMVNTLARLFRISISKGHELIPLKDELKHAESYLKIQKFRYGNQFTYEVDADETCLPYLCNKITIQPIIENAIYHGFQMVDEGVIHISIQHKDEDILICVEDNGVGMTEEHCREILKREPNDRTGIGIKNVNDRIRIYFGEKYGLHISSRLDEGTRVEILIPKVQKGSYDVK